MNESNPLPNWMGVSGCQIHGDNNHNRLPTIPTMLGPRLSRMERRNTWNVATNPTTQHTYCAVAFTGTRDGTPLIFKNIKLIIVHCYKEERH